MFAHPKVPSHNFNELWEGFPFMPLLISTKVVLCERNRPNLLQTNATSFLHALAHHNHEVNNAVKRYILEQEGKDVFEYSIFGDPTGQTKIGDFSC